MDIVSCSPLFALEMPITFSDLFMTSVHAMVTDVSQFDWDQCFRTMFTDMLVSPFRGKRRSNLSSSCSISRQ